MWFGLSTLTEHKQIGRRVPIAIPDLDHEICAIPGHVTKTLLFYRIDGSSGWVPCTAATAERLVTTRTWDDPWVTICLPMNDNHDPDGFRTYFQVLGAGSHALLVEGGGVDQDGWWDWTSAHGPQLERPAIVGPTWYQYEVDITEVQIAKDALKQIWAALADNRARMEAPPTFAWRWRHRDPEPQTESNDRTQD